MRILLYNWTPAGSPITEGGGVALYMANLAETLVADGHEVSILSSGFRYSLTDSKPRVRRRGRRGPIRYFDVINSPVAAPSFYMFPAAARVLECPALVELMRKFLQQTGPYDVVHIQNVEGLSFDVLTLADELPETRFVLTNHNYHVVCQQANLWRQDKVRCTDYAAGAHCVTCNVFPVDMHGLVIDRFLKFHGLEQSQLARKALGVLARLRRALGAKPAWDIEAPRVYRKGRVGPADLFRLRRHVALDLVNRHCFRVISVSKATEAVMLSYGLDPAISRVSYIGTRHFDPAVTRRAKPSAPHLRLAFLGYTRPDKGFHFLASAIEAMPRELHGRFSLHIAARVSDPVALARVEACAQKFSALTFQNGYRQEDLPSILEKTDLGLVLPQWDDALPQVAIEFVCHQVPILTTDRGGQQELAADPAFVFKADRIADFWAKLSAIERNRSELDRFWTLSRPLKTNADHMRELLAVYGEERAASAPDNVVALNAGRNPSTPTETPAQPRRSPTVASAL